MLLFHYRPLKILLTYVKCMARWSVTARCVYPYRSTASRIIRSRLTLSLGVLPLKMFSRAGLAAYRWLLGIPVYLCTSWGGQWALSRTPPCPITPDLWFMVWVVLQQWWTEWISKHRWAFYLSSVEIIFPQRPSKTKMIVSLTYWFQNRNLIYDNYYNIYDIFLDMPN